MRNWYVLLNLIFLSALVIGCGGQTAPADETGVSYRSEVVDTDYEDALGVSSQLALGTLQLEETEHAVKPEQAQILLPLWQAMQGGVTADAEIDAVLKGIEGVMTGEQLAAIADMRLTQDDMEAWAADRGLGARGDLPGVDLDPDARATRQTESGGEGGPRWGEGMLSEGEMPDEMATRVAEFQGLTDEEREAMRATVQAGGGPGTGLQGGPGGVAGSRRQTRLFLRPLIALLEARAVEAEG